MAAKRVVVLACGNRSRGDDALGPMLLDRVAELQLEHVRAFEAYQFNIEHALDLEDTDVALFIDAGDGTPGPFTFGEVVASDGLCHSTHALEPASVLATFSKINGRAHPAAYSLCVRGEQFDLGAAMSTSAVANLEQASTFIINYIVGLAPH